MPRSFGGTETTFSSYNTGPFMRSSANDMPLLGVIPVNRGRSSHFPLWSLNPAFVDGWSPQKNNLSVTKICFWKNWIFRQVVPVLALCKLNKKARSRNLSCPPNKGRPRLSCISTHRGTFPIFSCTFCMLIDPFISTNLPLPLPKHLQRRLRSWSRRARWSPTQAIAFHSSQVRETTNYWSS